VKKRPFHWPRLGRGRFRPSLNGRLPAAPSEAKKQRNWLSTGISVAALIVSGSSAYYGIILARDELHVIIQDSPIVFLDKQDRISVGGPQGLIFLNTGTRTAAVTEISLGLVNVTGQDETKIDCNKGQTVYLQYSFDPVAIKASEIITLKLEEPLVPIFWVASEAHVRTFSMKTTDGDVLKVFKAGDRLLTCLRFIVIAPYSAVREIKVAKSIISVETFEAIDINRRRRISGGTPQLLVRKSDWQFRHLFDQ
jgi:hypothetical protein